RLISSRCLVSQKNCAMVSLMRGPISFTSSSSCALINASEQELLEVNEVGPRIAESIAQFFREPRNRELIKQLREAGLKFTGKKKERGTKLAGKTFVLTGTLAHYPRDEAKKMIEDA